MTWWLILGWVIAGLLYVNKGAYDRHGIWSLLIILPYMIVGACWALISNLIRPK